MASIARGRSRRRQGDGSSGRNAAHSTVLNPDHQGPCVPAFLLQIPMALLGFLSLQFRVNFRTGFFFGESKESM